MSASLTLDKLLSRSSFYKIACFSIFASELHWSLLLLQKIFSEVPILMLLYSMWTTDMDASLVMEDCFRSSWPPGHLNGYSPVLLQMLPLILKNCLCPSVLLFSSAKSPWKLRHVLFFLDILTHLVKDLTPFYCRLAEMESL